MTRRLLLCFAVFLGGYPRSVEAEGSAEVSTRFRLRQDTVLFVDIVDPSTETITWTGQGTLTVRDPNNAVFAVLMSGQTATLVGRTAGAYLLDPNTSQGPATTWDVRVNNPSAPGGRLWSTNWHLIVGDTSAPGGNFSMYARAPGAEPSTDTIVELQFRGIQGDVHDLIANQRGVNGPNGSRSVPSAGNGATPQLALYLNRPAVAVDASTVASVTDFGFAADDSNGNCAAVVPGHDGGSFRFSSNVTGTYQIVCDLNGDQTFDRVDATDLLLTGTVQPGPNLVPWSGVDRQGAPISIGIHQCRVEVIVGEVHFIASDIETLYPGLRVFDATSSSARPPLRMFWDDMLVQAGDVLMPAPTSAVGRQSSGSAGLSSGASADATQPNVNARSWGNFGATSKGKGALLDTFVLAQLTAAPPLTVVALDPSLVVDGGVCSSCAATMCGGRGTCSTEGTCECSSGFAGASCQYSDSVNCTSHGAAQADGGCACATGFAGVACASCAMNFFNYPTCTYCEAATTCSGHGACTTLGMCSCTSGFAGRSCQFSDAVTCNGRGSAQGDGGCVCTPLFAGSACELCAEDRYGYPTCTLCTAATSCSGNGICAALGGCTCDAGFSGSSCQFSDSVTCSAHGVAQSDAGCVCAAGFAGKACDECALHHYEFPVCRQCDFATCTGTCSDRGLCIEFDGGAHFDGGALADAGVANDAGIITETDSGAPGNAAFTDAGASPDSGTGAEVELGANDAGSSVQQPPRGCGCSTDLGSIAVLGIAALAGGRRRSRAPIRS